MSPLAVLIFLMVVGLPIFLVLATCLLLLMMGEY
jgi:hypothetical protein